MGQTFALISLGVLLNLSKNVTHQNMSQMKKKLHEPFTLAYYISFPHWVKHHLIYPRGIDCKVVFEHLTHKSPTLSFSGESA